MLNPLSENEILILDRQVAAIGLQLGEIANLLETRLGTNTETAALAKSIQREFAILARRIHRQSLLSGAGLRVERKAHSA